MTNAAEQVATVQYSTPAESVVVLVPRPIPAESVALAIRTPDGSDVPVTPVPGAPGRFVSFLRVGPGETYRLVGSVLGRTIEARVTVPGPLIVREPAGDTLRMSVLAYEEGRRVEVPYVWHAVGAVAYLVQVTSTVTPQLGRARILQDTSGTLTDGDFLPGRPETALFRIWAFDTAASAFYLPLGGTEPRPGNISGALGLFAAAAVLDPPKTVLWQ